MGASEEQEKDPIIFHGVRDFAVEELSFEEQEARIDEENQRKYQQEQCFGCMTFLS